MWLIWFTARNTNNFVEAIALSESAPDDNASPTDHDEVRVHLMTNFHHHLPSTDLMWWLNDHIVQWVSKLCWWNIMWCAIMISLCIECLSTACSYYNQCLLATLVWCYCPLHTVISRSSTRFEPDLVGRCVLYSYRFLDPLVRWITTGNGWNLRRSVWLKPNDVISL